MNKQDIKQLAIEIHEANVAAGWWPTEDRNRPEIMALIHSEISEAFKGHVDRLMDDKLPHLPMFDVEIADVAIRALDLIGAEYKKYPDSDWPFDHTYDGVSWLCHTVLPTMSLFETLLRLHLQVTNALEGLRKGKNQVYVDNLIGIVMSCIAIANHTKFDIFDVMEQKRNFNKTRPDHQPENRAKEGGKSF